MTILHKMMMKITIYYKYIIQTSKEHNLYANKYCCKINNKTE